MPFQLSRRSFIAHQNPQEHDLESFSSIQVVNDSESRESRRLLVMAQNHLFAWLVIMYIIYFICRYGFGWTPGSGKPAPAFTIHFGEETSLVEMDNAHSRPAPFLDEIND